MCCLPETLPASAFLADQDVIQSKNGQSFGGKQARMPTYGKLQAAANPQYDVDSSDEEVMCFKSGCRRSNSNSMAVLELLRNRLCFGTKALGVRHVGACAPTSTRLGDLDSIAPLVTNTLLHKPDAKVMFFKTEASVRNLVRMHESAKSPKRRHGSSQ